MKMEDKDLRNYATIMHLSPLAGYLIPLAGFLVPVVLWILKRDQSPYIDRQGKEVLNFLITLTLAAIVTIPLCFILIGIPILVILWLAALVLSIIASVRTSEGIDYRYPYILRLIK